MRKFAAFTRDLLLQGIGFWIVPWIGATFVAFELYTQAKAEHDFNDLGLGWPLIVLALMILVGKLGMGARMQAVYDRHFPPHSD